MGLVILEWGAYGAMYSGKKSLWIESNWMKSDQSVTDIHRSGHNSRRTRVRCWGVEYWRWDVRCNMGWWERWPGRGYVDSQEVNHTCREAMHHFNILAQIFRNTPSRSITPIRPLLVKASEACMKARPSKDRKVRMINIVSATMAHVRLRAVTVTLSELVCLFPESWTYSFCYSQIEYDAISRNRGTYMCTRDRGYAEMIELHPPWGDLNTSVPETSYRNCIC